MALIESETMAQDFAWIPKLMTSVLMQACRDLQASALGRTRKIAQKQTLIDGSVKVYRYAKSPSKYVETRAWFLSLEATTFSLVTICRVLGINRGKILLKLAPYLCPGLAHLRKPYIPVEWRNSMKDCKTSGRAKAA